MATYTNAWNSGAPLGSVDPRLIDDEIRKHRLDSEERMNSIIGLSDANNGWTKDPIIDGVNVKSLRALTVALLTPDTISVATKLTAAKKFVQGFYNTGTWTLSPTIDLANGNFQKGQISSNGITVTVTNAENALWYLWLTTDNIGQTITWPANFKWHTSSPAITGAVIDATTSHWLLTIWYDGVNHHIKYDKWSY